MEKCTCVIHFSPCLSEFYDHLTKDDIPEILLWYSGKVICTEDHITTRSCAYKVHAKRSSNLSDPETLEAALLLALAGARGSCA
jgi:hypothetical protein